MAIKDETVSALVQSEPLQKEKNRILRIVQDDKSRRDQENKFFRNQTLSTYTDASIRQFIGHREKPEWKKDYQYNLFDPITREKVNAIISKSAGIYEAQFFNTNKRLQKASDVIATILAAFYKDSVTRLDEVETNREVMTTALIEPKAIWYEGWRNQKRTIRDIEDRDEFGNPTSYKAKKIVHYNGPWGEIVPVGDFIPGSLRVRRLQEQPRMSWVAKMQFEDFKRMFPASRFPEVAKVRPHGQLFDNDLTEFTVRDDLKENEVEVIRFFEKWEDRMSIMANYTLLTKPGTPMPFAHKDYPFVWGGFEMLHPQFIYDMPLPIKILDMQDMNNEILNLTLDMVWRALQEIILVSNGDGINDDVMYGGGMVEVNDPNNFQKLQFGSSFGFQSAQRMQEMAKRSIEASSVDAALSGQAGSRPNITAREVTIAREAALEITTLFLQNMEAMEKSKAELRVKNQLDRYKMPIEWQKRIGEDNTEEAIALFREISVRDAKLTNGKRGRVNISITEEPRSKEELDKINIENDKELSQTIDVTPEFIRDLSFEVEIVANSSRKRTKAQEVAEARAFMTDAIAVPQVLSVEYAAREYVKALGKKEDEAIVTQQQPQVPGEAQKPPKPTPGGAPESIESVLNLFE